MRTRKRDDFLQWLRCQPSCIDGNFSEYINGEGRNPVCHVRRAKDSGIGFKGNTAVPMTQEQHMLQHQKGEAACLSFYFGIDVSPESAKKFFDMKGQYYREKYLNDRD